MSATPSNKKSKTCAASAEIEAVRHHLLSCNQVPRSSRALQVALQALDQEQQRMERDLKLQRKFASTATAETSFEKESTNKKDTNSGVSGLPELKQKPQNTTNHQQQQRRQQQEDDADDLLMEWQDVTTPSQEDDLMEEEAGSILGKSLSQAAISKMATYKTTVASPLGAIALALHATLCSDVLGFKCTGIPSDEASKGFAAPIRELPKGQLVPTKWDKNSTTVKLRYRKDGVGSTVLLVSLDQNYNHVHVQLAPSGGASKEAPLELSFPIDSHVNLSSLSKALQNEPRVVPTLHYKALPVLLTNMCNTFDLGPVQDDAPSQGETTATPYVDTTIVAPPSQHEMSRPTYITSVGEPTTSRRVYNQHEPPTMRVFQPESRRPGDFSSDLLPAAGGMMTMDPRPGGNLMGPNHPAFGGNHSGIGGGYGMRPRFDPFGPPNGPQDPNHDDNNNLMDPRRPQQQPRRPPPPPGGLGDPNPDHERPPSNLSNNMYM